MSFRSSSTVARSQRTSTLGSLEGTIFIERAEARRRIRLGEHVDCLAGLTVGDLARQGDAAAVDNARPRNRDRYRRWPRCRRGRGDQEQRRRQPSPARKTTILRIENTSLGIESRAQKPSPKEIPTIAVTPAQPGKDPVNIALSLCGCQIFEQRFPAERLVGLPAATPARASA